MDTFDLSTIQVICPPYSATQVVHYRKAWSVAIHFPESGKFIKRGGDESGHNSRQELKVLNFSVGCFRKPSRRMMLVITTLGAETFLEALCRKFFGAQLISNASEHLYNASILYCI